MRNSLITEFLKPIDKTENKIQAEHLKRIGELETHSRRLEKEKTLLLKERDEIRSVHKKPLTQKKKSKSGHQKKQKQENSNQLPAKQESRGEAFKSVPAEKSGRSSEEKEQAKRKQQQQQQQQQQQNANQPGLRQQGQQTMKFTNSTTATWHDSSCR